MFVPFNPVRDKLITKGIKGTKVGMHQISVMSCSCCINAVRDELITGRIKGTKVGLASDLTSIMFLLFKPSQG